MSREISLFADFKQGENRVTNYCGLMLKLLYQESAVAFEAAINNLLGDHAISVNPDFRQQTRKKNSVPDLTIEQTSFQLLFEVKTTDWFYSDQIRRHLEGMADSHAQSKTLFLLCNEEIDNYDMRFEQTIQFARELGIHIQPTTFEMLLESIKQASNRLSDQFASMLKEFEGYLDSIGVLPSWRCLLDVISCGKSMDEVENGAYMCPNTGGAYAHKRARFFCSYQNKQVTYIAEILAVVILGADDDTGELCVKGIRWNNSSKTEKELSERALSQIKHSGEWRKEEALSHGTQVFLLGDLHETAFRKETPGGMMGSKQYFYNIPKDITAQMLADQLKGQTWENWE